MTDAAATGSNLDATEAPRRNRPSVLALVALIVAVSGGLANAYSMSELQDQVDSLERQNAALEKTQKDVKKLRECLPELYTYVNGLELIRESLYITSNSQISRVCGPVLYGTSTSDEP